MVEGAAAARREPQGQPAPGHTPGTIAIKFESRGEKALFCGDILHHALQVYHPEWNSFACGEAGRRAQEPARGAGALRRLGRAPDALPFRRAVHLPYRPQGRGFVPRFDGSF